MFLAPDSTGSPRAIGCGSGSPVRWSSPTCEKPSRTSPSTGTTSPARTSTRSPARSSEAATSVVSASSEAGPVSRCALSGLSRARASREACAPRDSRSSMTSDRANSSRSSAPSWAWPMRTDANAARVMRKCTSSLAAAPSDSTAAGTPSVTKTARGPSTRNGRRAHGSTDTANKHTTVAMEPVLRDVSRHLRSAAFPGTHSGISPCEWPCEWPWPWPWPCPPCSSCPWSWS
mmetsp:Transcript_69899/g.195053  ORF Transcript_69899/g.195053 Transcript_69899/m.195053 type:complete len:232 (+) Transcript_69899:485-1180(+)